MKKLDIKGFGTIEVILFLVLVGIIGGIGWYVWQNKQKTDKLNSISTFAECKAGSASKLQESYPEVCVTKNGKSFPNPDQKITPLNTETQKQNTTNYLIIKEWGIKFEMEDADKLTYKLSSENSDGKVTETATPFLKDGVSKICQSIYAAYARSKTSDSMYSLSIKSGNYYYGAIGSGQPCANDPGGIDGPINQLRSKILHEMNPSKISPI